MPKPRLTLLELGSLGFHWLLEVGVWSFFFLRQIHRIDIHRQRQALGQRERGEQGRQRAAEAGYMAGAQQ